MGDAWISHSHLTLEEYEHLEVSAEDKRYEYYFGSVWAMAGASPRHNTIVLNMYRSLYSHFRNKGCRTYTESVKLEVVAKKCYFYPDLMLTCNPVEHTDKQIKDPVLIVEVLSDGTEKIDLGNKADVYTKIPGLKAYVIIAQKECWIRIYERKGDFWAHRTVDELTDSLILPDLDWEIPLTEVYADVEFDQVS